VTPKRRGVLYQKVLSSEEPGFISEPAEVQTMLATVSSALGELKPSKQITWLLDSGFDDVAVWRTIFEQQEHVVCRAYHRDRMVQWQTEQGAWTSGPLQEAAARLKLLAEVRTTMEVKRGKQAHPKKQAVEVEISACTFQITPIIVKCAAQVRDQTTSFAKDSGSSRCWCWIPPWSRGG
jgi:hypothetical protein